MDDLAISVRGLGKRYRIGERESRPRTLRDALLGGRERASPSGEEFLWALRDATFDVRCGEVVGVIGRNGAGKSTLLKILSRITEPTEGEAELVGRVASLLEVGTGFHPELTGRENVYLNGAILGMGRAEIDRKFDQIAAFAEVDRFLDVPIKRYSSGMHVRLAFAVAAHLEPDVLLVDEVLAVGDAAFQRKCMGKIDDVAKTGRTVLFVSHNMGAVEELTQRCLWIDGGRVALDAPTRHAIEAYLDSAPPDLSHPSLAEWPERAGTGQARLAGLRLYSSAGEERRLFKPGEPIRLAIEADFLIPLEADLMFCVENRWERPLFSSRLSDSLAARRCEGRREFRVEIDPNRLRPGRYLLTLAIFSKDLRDCFDEARRFPAFEIIRDSEGTDATREDSRPGDLYFPLRWEAPD